MKKHSLRHIQICVFPIDFPKFCSIFSLEALVSYQDCRQFERLNVREYLCVNL